MTVEDLQALHGIQHYSNAARMHKQIRLGVSGGVEKRFLTIREYCKYQQLNFDEIWYVLRPDAPNPYLGKPFRDEEDSPDESN